MRVLCVALPVVLALHTDDVQPWLLPDMAAAAIDPAEQRALPGAASPFLRVGRTFLSNDPWADAEVFLKRMSARKLETDHEATNPLAFLTSTSAECANIVSVELPKYLNYKRIQFISDTCKPGAEQAKAVISDAMYDFGAQSYARARVRTRQQASMLSARHHADPAVLTICSRLALASLSNPRTASPSAHPSRCTRLGRTITPATAPSTTSVCRSCPTTPGASSALTRRCVASFPARFRATSSPSTSTSTRRISMTRRARAASSRPRLTTPPFLPWAAARFSLSRIASTLSLPSLFCRARPCTPPRE